MPTPQRPRAEPAVRRGPEVLVAAAVMGLAVAALRLFRSSVASDIFVDEVIYLRVGHSLTTGHVPMTPEGTLFFLHPPGFFYLASAWEQLLGIQPDLIDGVYQLRLLNALIAAATAAVMLVLVRHVAPLGLAAAAAGLFAVDAFAVRHNGLALLETATLLWVLLGYLVLLPLVQRRAPHDQLRGLVGGLLFGLAIFTKDEAVLVTLVPLVAVLGLRWSQRRGPVLLACGAALVPYSLWIVGMGTAGHLDELAADKLLGLKRMVGVIQVTGFNVPGAPSLVGRLVDEARYFAPTYLVLTAGFLAFLVVLRRGDTPRRLLALPYAGALVLMAIVVVKGALEEQRLYFLLVPSYVVVAVGLAILLERSDRRRWWAAIASGLAALALVSGATTYVSWRTTPDVGYATLRAWMLEHVPPGSAVTAADGSVERGVSYWVLSDSYRVGRWLTPEDRLANDVRYLVIPWDVVRQGYSYSDPDEVEQVVSTGTLLLRVTGRRYGDLDLYELPIPRSREPAPEPLHGP